MPTGPYNLPQGIEIDGQRTQAVPRKVGAYDTEGQDTAAAGFTSPLIFFQNATAFGNTGLSLSKQYGRDVNITSRTGGMAKGERLYTYGVTAKWYATINASNTFTLMNTAAQVTDTASVLNYWCGSDVNFKLGADEFIRTQARDIPLWAPRISAHTLNNALAYDLCSEGMYDLTIAGDPYVLDQQEDFRIELATATLQTGNLPVLEWYFTFRLEGIRLKALRQ